MNGHIAVIDMFAVATVAFAVTGIKGYYNNAIATTATTTTATTTTLR